MQPEEPYPKLWRFDFRFRTKHGLVVRDAHTFMPKKNQKKNDETVAMRIAAAIVSVVAAFSVVLACGVLVSATSLAEPPRMAAPAPLVEPRRVARHTSIFSACRTEIIAYKCTQSVKIRDAGTGAARRAAIHATQECLRQKQGSMSNTNACQRWLEAMSVCEAEGREQGKCDDAGMLNTLRGGTGTTNALPPPPPVPTAGVVVAPAPAHLSNAGQDVGANGGEPAALLSRDASQLEKKAVDDTVVGVDGQRESLAKYRERWRKQRQQLVRDGQVGKSMVDPFTLCLMHLHPAQLSDQCRQTDYWRSLVFMREWRKWRDERAGAPQQHQSQPLALPAPSDR
jgi:hypothetical protein